MIVNLTPHAIDIYRAGTPDTLPPDTVITPSLTLPPSGKVARIEEVRLPRPGQRWYGAEALTRNGLDDILDVAYGHVTNLPGMRPATWLLVSLACALALPARIDLLVPYEQVRNEAGTVIGCRRLARPV
jgi:hypothetical protein